jgi:lactate dehydrogenase-like 2-hydroxyacid dehydrogenase
MTPLEKPDVLCFRRLHPLEQQLIGASYTVYIGDTPQKRREMVATFGSTLRAVLTAGQAGLTDEEMDAMPKLGIVCFSGSGHEGINLERALRRGIAVTNSLDANAASVADHALGLMLAVARRIPLNDRRVRERKWRESDRLPSMLSRKHLGIVGLGNIGSRIAHRAAGFDMEISYYNRHPRPELPFQCAESVLELAKWSDFLVLCAPGGPETRHIVDAAVLDALGSEGFLVNVARGSLVDTLALIAALHGERIAGAALDVFDDEPSVPEALCELPNVVLSPHLGAHSVESLCSKAEMVLENLNAYFAGKPVLTPIKK